MWIAFNAERPCEAHIAEDANEAIRLACWPFGFEEWTVLTQIGWVCEPFVRKQDVSEQLRCKNQ